MKKKNPYELRLVAWELTQACPLKCGYCRAKSRKTRDANELSFEECKRLIDDIVSFSRPILILSGGDPVLRPDMIPIAEYATRKNLRTVCATTGMLLDDEKVKEMKGSGILRVSISFDSASEKKHDAVRGEKGAFKKAVEATELLKNNEMEFQINCTITTENADEIPSILEMAAELGATGLHFFLIVPTGRARDAKKFALDSERYDEVLQYLAGVKETAPLDIKLTCAPHFQRIIAERGEKKRRHQLSGCLAGTSFVFVSHTGEVKPCGYLDVVCGNVREKSLKDIWNNSEILQELRDRESFDGTCGICEFREICGGCRARAYEINGSYTGEEPFCSYVPKNC